MTSVVAAASSFSPSLSFGLVGSKTRSVVVIEGALGICKLVSSLFDCRLIKTFGVCGGLLCDLGF